MKVPSFCALLLLVVTAFTFFIFSGTTTGASWFADLVGTKYVDETTPIAVSRKLKENVKRIKGNEKGDIGDRVSLEDYNPIDPTPGGAKNVNAGPIEHGTPLMPFIPKSPPPIGQSNPGPGDYD
ncbi:uncharacterized protein LOC127092362 [Lathyrus oleraceus]|uniref:Uncharacterized protein n=1 Tax=Pisum sativum TaxID=3888 RepID=A0A9D4W2X3_PEA|nr:uncharacterized protein LOC127092362 [Pisum sativum]KAI5393256.1 hypothetical protein KIW84_060394 [Pisum sativum]